MSDFGKRFIEYAERFTKIVNNTISDQMEKFSKSYASGAYLRTADSVCKEFEKNAVEWYDAKERRDKLLKIEKEETQFRMRYF